MSAASQYDLLAAAPVPRTRAGTHLEVTGSDAAGPLLEVCDACRCDVAWNPGNRCTTPGVHAYKDPGPEPEEGEDMDERTKEAIADQVDIVLALQGEDVNGPAARAACLRLTGQNDFTEYPEKRGEQVEYVERLAMAVLTDLAGAPPPEQAKTSGVVKEGWDADSEGAQIIRSPIGT